MGGKQTETAEGAGGGRRESTREDPNQSQVGTGSRPSQRQEAAGEPAGSQEAQDVGS